MENLIEAGMLRASKSLPWYKRIIKFFRTLTNALYNAELPKHSRQAAEFNLSYRGRSYTLFHPNSKFHKRIFSYFLDKNMLETRSQFHRKLGKHDAYVDIGGNLGYYAVLNILTGAFSRAFVFEPSSYNFSILEKNLKSFPNVKCFQLGCSDTKGEATLAMPLKLYDNWYNKLNNTGILSLHGKGNYKKEQIPLENFDDFTRKNNIEIKNSFIKLDVEGHEYYVLAGMKEAIKAGNTFQVEFNLKFNTQLIQGIFKFFSDENYRSYRFNEKNCFEPVSIGDLDIYPQIDIIFSRQNLN